MAKTRIAIVLAVLACSLVFVAAAFAAFEKHEWAGNGYHLESGQNGFLNENVILDESKGKGESRAVCAGIRGFEGEVCVGRGAEAVFTTKGIAVEGDPYIHNHDPEAGYFHAWFWGEY